MSIDKYILQIEDFVKGLQQEADKPEVKSFIESFNKLKDGKSNLKFVDTREPKK